MKYICSDLLIGFKYHSHVRHFMSHMGVIIWTEEIKGAYLWI